MPLRPSDPLGARAHLSAVSLSTGVLLLLLSSACGGSDSVGVTPPKTVTAIELSVDSLYFGGLTLSRSISGTGRAADGTIVSGATITWSSSDEAIATVSSGGAVSAVSVGEAEIRATSGSGTASAKVVVEQIPAGLRLTPSAVTFDTLDQIAELTAVVLDSGTVEIPGIQDVHVFSGDNDVVGIVGTLVIQAHGPGSTQVTAYSESTRLTTSVSVTVSVADLAGVVGAEGGTVQAEDGMVVLNLPAGAVPDRTALTVRAVTAPGSIPGTAFEFGPPIAFGQPVEMSIAYDEAALPSGTSEVSLGLYREVSGGWEPVEGIRTDDVKNRVRGLVRSTGKYSMRPGWLRNPTGLWRVTETIVSDDCFDEAGNVEFINVWAEFDGNDFTIERDGEAVSGTLVGDEFGWDVSYASTDYEGVDVREVYSVRIDPGGERASGRGRLIGSGAVSCEVVSTLTAEKIGDQRPLRTDVDRLRMNLEMSPPVRPGETVHVEAVALDGPTSVRGAFVVLQIENRALFAPGTPSTIEAFTDVKLEVAEAGSTRMRIYTFNDAGDLVASEWVDLTFEAETTEIEVLGPPQTVMQPDLTTLEGKEFEREPDLAFRDSNPDASRWELVFEDGARYRVAPGCRQSSICTENLTMVWDHIDPEVGAESATLIGYNPFDAPVSEGSVVFRPEPNRVTFAAFLGSNGGGGEYWTALGFSGDPTPYSTPQNSNWAYCRGREDPLCLHGHVSYDGRFGKVAVSDGTGEQSASNIFDRTVSVRLPDFLTELGSTGWESTGTGLHFSQWNCDGSQYDAIEPVLSVDVRVGGQHFSTPKSKIADDLQCEGDISVQIDEYTDLRGTWRRFTVSASGTFYVRGGPSGPDVSTGTLFAVFSIKWAAGENEPLWDRVAEPGGG